MPKLNKNYSSDHQTQENINFSEKYDATGESEFSRDLTLPFDQNEVLSERHYHLSPLGIYGKKRLRINRNLIQSEPGHRGKGPKGYKRSDDKIKDDVNEHLYRSTAVDASEIEVFVKDGIVTLKGSVKSRNQKVMAEDAIEYVPGVKDIFNEMIIRDNVHNLTL
jgi:hypothetical protein